MIGSIIDYRYAPDDPESALEVLAAPSTRIISLTITEGGYRDPDGPAFALIAEALDRRRRRGIAAPTIVSCDNIENNGEVARRAVLANAERRDPGLAEWVAEHVQFPSSMVDRITPSTTLEMAAEVRRDFGVNDRWPVVAEPFTAWVLEDKFADGRPPLEQAGVLLVDDVAPYELMKLRLLNAGHQCLATSPICADSSSSTRRRAIRCSPNSCSPISNPRPSRRCRRCPGSTCTSTAAR